MDRFNITTEDPETSVVINELSGLNLNESQVGLNQFEEKQEDVSSDEGNEDPTDEKDDDEQVIQSVMSLNINENDDETDQEPKAASISYASKGPMVQKRSRAAVNANAVPYNKNKPQVDNRKTNSLMKELSQINDLGDLGLDVDGFIEEHCTLGQFVDVASFLPELALNNANETSPIEQKWFQLNRNSKVWNSIITRY